MTSAMAPRQRKTTADPAEGCRALLLATVIMPPIIIFDGWALSIMWGWFVIGPTGWAAIGVWEAAGLMVIKSIVSYQYSAADQAFEREQGPLRSMLNHVCIGVLATSMSLGIGWALHGLAT